MPQHELPFPTDVERAAQALGARLRRFADTRCTDDKFHYETLLPADWSFDPPEPRPIRQPGQLTLLGRLRAKRANATAVVEVYAAVIPRDVGPADWAELAAGLPKGRIELRRREQRVSSGVVADVLWLDSIDAGHPMVTRSTAIKDANRIFHIRATVAEEHYATFADDLMLSVCAFKLINAEGKPFAENTVAFAGEGVPSLHFSYPVSWSLVAPTSLTTTKPAAQDANLIARLVDPHDSPQDGALAVFFVANEGGRGNADDLLSFHFKELSRSGVDVRSKEVAPVPEPAPYLAGTLLNVRGQRGSVGMDCPALVLLHPEGRVLLSLITADQANAGIWWAVHKRAFEIVRDSLAIGGV